MLLLSARRILLRRLRQAPMERSPSSTAGDGRCHLTLAFLLTLLTAMSAVAHGVWAPKHRGLMNNDLGETAFELVSIGKQVVIHLEDHGEPIPTDGARATMAIRGSMPAHTAVLTGGGRNRLTGRLVRPLKENDQVVVNVSFKNGSIAEGRFAMPARAPEQRTP